MTLLGTWDDETISRYSDIWGYADPVTGKEYALLGSSEFIHILDVTDPANIVESHRLNTFTNSGSRWRDIKVFDTYAYCVTDVDVNEGIQVIDLSDIDNTDSDDMIVFNSQLDFSRCHNIFIDSTASPARLYAFGTNTNRDGYQIFSLENPASPTLMASVNLRQNGFTGGYIHDGYAVNDTLYANSENRGMYVYDVTDPEAPVELGILDGYGLMWGGEGYNHSSWRTPDGKTMVMCDETRNVDVKIVNVEDPADMEVVASFRSQLRMPTTSNHIAHNPYILNNEQVVMSYYGDGIQVWDIADRTTPVRLGYYLTTDPNTITFTGNWGTYPFLPSGNILGSDLANGLIVVSLDDVSLPVSYSSWTAVEEGKNALLEWTITAERNNAGYSVEHAVEGGSFAEIAFVEAGQLANSLVHESPGPGIHFYRLRQIDLDGTEHLSELRSVSFDGFASSVTAFPNPAPAGKEIMLTGIGPNASWELWTVAGQLVQRGTGSRLTANVATGMYYLRVEGEVVTNLVITR